MESYIQIENMFNKKNQEKKKKASMTVALRFLSV